MDFGFLADIDKFLSLGFDNYGMLAVFIGTLFTGEVAILLSITFAMTGVFSFVDVILVTTFATFCADFFWFLIGRYFSNYFSRFASIQNLLSFSNTKDQEFISKNAPYILLVSRFAYGLRLILTVWLAMIGVSIRRFIIMNTLGTVIYIVILCMLGVGAHKGMQTLSLVSNPWISFSVALLLTLIISISVRNRLGKIKQFEKVLEQKEKF